MNDRTAVMDVRQLEEREKISVRIANGQIIRPYATGYFILENSERLPVFLFKELTGSLVSVGQIVDAMDARAVFESSHMYISKKCDGQILLRGTRCPTTKLWLADITKQVTVSLSACAAHEVPVHTMQELVRYWAESFGCPAPSTFLRIVKSGRLVIPEITHATLLKYSKVLHSVASAKGHLDLTRQGIRSTDPEKRNSRRSTRAPNTAATNTREEDERERIHIDLTGQLHDKYVMLMYTSKKNYIHFELVDRRLKGPLLDAFKAGLAFFREHGVHPRTVRMDNEISDDFRDMAKEENLTLDIVPPNCHRRNKAERGIRTAKNHLIATMANAHPDFPMTAVKHLFAQAEITLNLMRDSPNAHVTAWEDMFGRPYDFNRHPIGPPGTRVVIHDKTRTTWAPHGLDGYYVGPAMDGYRSATVYVSATRSLRITDTLSWHFHSLETESTCSDARLTGVVNQLERAITAIHPNDLTKKTVQAFTRAETSLKQLTSTLTTIVRAHQQTHETAQGAPAIQHPIQTLPPVVSTPAPPQRVAVEPASSVETAAAPQRVAVEPASSVETAAAPQRVAVEPASSVETAAAPQRVAVEPASSVDTAAAPQRVASSVEPAAAPQRVRVERHAVTSAPLVAVTPAPPISRAPRTAQTVPTAPNTPAASSPPSASNIQAAASPSARVQQRRGKQRKHKKPAQGQGNGYRTRSRTFEEANMIVQRFNGDAKGGRGRRAAPTVRKPKWRKRRQQSARDAADQLWKAQCAYANTAVDLDEDGNKLVYHRAKAGPNGALWENAAGQEISRLIESQTGSWVHLSDIPKARKIAYYNPRCRTKIKNGELVYRVRGTIGGDQVDFDGDTAAYTASMQTLKLLLNSVVSTEGGKFATADIKDYYLGTPLLDKHGNAAVEYMRIALDHIPADVQEKYDLAQFAHNGAVYMKIAKSIYGLPQAGRQAQDRLVKHLKADGYLQCKNTPSLFRHNTRDIAFTLVVDDFGIKYTKEEDLEHFLATLRKLYEITEDRALTQKYVGITIYHDRAAHTIQLSMPGYVAMALVRFNMETATGANSPAIYVPPEYGAKVQYDEVDDDTPADAATKTRIQQIVGVFLFYARAVDPTMLCAINKLASKQAAPTADIATQADRILQYASRFPNASIIIRASDMQLRCHSDASYLSEAHSRSRAGGILFLGAIDPVHGVNGAIDYLSCIINTVVASATEAEYAALFLVGREATSASQTLIDLGHPQQATLIICDNACAVGIANRAVKQKQSKSINMRYHWIRDQVDLDAFVIKWEPGSENLADYFTKNHPVHHHKSMRNVYVTDKPSEHLAHTCVLALITHTYSDKNNYYSALSP